MVATPHTTMAATPAISTSAITEAISTERMPAVASAWSSATMTIQSVPGMARAPSSLALPPTSTCSGAVAPASVASLSAVSAGMRSVTGLSVSLSSVCATISPDLATSMPKLAGVGWIALTLATTASMATSPETTALTPPSRTTGTAKATTSLPVPAST
ncbi:hypothetical protein D9M72_503020 [compost metagenome]